MERLPPELRHHVFEQLSCNDLKAMRLANKWHAALITPGLFETLHLWGPGHRFGQPPVNINPNRVEFGGLANALPNLFSIAPHVKKLVFAPAYYREGFWNDYQTSVLDLDKPTSMEPPRHSFQSLDDDGQEIGWDDYRLIKRRQSLEEQRETLLKAEKRWAQRRERQTANKDSDETSLQDLLKLMTSLETIEIQKWRILEYNGLKFDTDPDAYAGKRSPRYHNLQILARCFQKSQRHIGEIHMEGFGPHLIEESAELRHIFTKLRSLRLGVLPEALVENSPIHHTFTQLLKQSQPTLERLDLTCQEIPLTSALHFGSHDLGKVLSDGDTNLSLIFPRLQHFRLAMLRVTTDSLLGFIAAQPQINTLEFEHVYLRTIGKGWAHLIKALPKRIQTWEVTTMVGEMQKADYPDSDIKHRTARFEFQQLPSFAETVWEPLGWRSKLLPGWRCRFHRMEPPQDQLS